MKKGLAFVLILLLAFTLCACAGAASVSPVVPTDVVYDATAVTAGVSVTALLVLLMLVVFFVIAPVIVLLCILIPRKKRRAAQQKPCPGCGASVPKNADFCPKCGYSFKDTDTQNK